MNIKDIKTGTILLLLFLGLTSCKDDMMEEISTLKVDRTFSPTGLSATIVNQTGIRLNWKEVNNAKIYTIEVYKNVDFSGTPIKAITDITFAQVPYTLAGLDGDTEYALRVKAIGEGIDDSKWITALIKTDAEQIFQDITAEKLMSRSVTLNWPAGENATSLTIMPGNIVHTVTPSEITNGEVTISGLTPKTSYTATLLLNNVVRGTKVFNTPAELPTGADVVYVAATDDLAAMIQAATKSTRFVILEGTKYNSDVPVNIPAGLDISVIGEVATTKPIVSFNQIMLPTVGGKLHFENVELTGYANGNASSAKRSYIINQSVASNMDEVSYENCTIHHYVNSPMRLQSGNSITINNFMVINCIVDDIGDNGGVGTYALIHSNVATAKINNITITNSTFSNLGYGLILHNQAPSLSVTIENNTFYNIIGDARYFIDYNTQTVAGAFSFKNNILGKTLSPAATARGIRSGTAPSVSNNFKTSDANMVANPIPNLVSYSGTSSDLFIAPTSKDFKIKDGAFEGKSSSGDPRWR